MAEANRMFIYSLGKAEAAMLQGGFRDRFHISSWTGYFFRPSQTLWIVHREVQFLSIGIYTAVESKGPGVC